MQYNHGSILCKSYIIAKLVEPRLMLSPNKKTKVGAKHESKFELYIYIVHVYKSISSMWLKFIALVNIMYCIPI